MHADDATLTPRRLLEAADALKKGVRYPYVRAHTRMSACILSVAVNDRQMTLGRFRRRARKETKVTVSRTMLEIVCSALSSRRPVNLDEALKGSNSNRSLLEAVLARLPEFHVVHLPRGDVPSRRRTHKHIVWLPERPHAPGKLSRIDPSELPASPERQATPRTPPPRRMAEDEMHTWAQAGCVRIGMALGAAAAWVPPSDRPKALGAGALGGMKGIIGTLHDAPARFPDGDLINACREIDVMWLSRTGRIEAMLEIEHSTRVRPGLDRMNGAAAILRKKRMKLPPCVIVAPDREIDLFMRYANAEKHRYMKPLFLSYSRMAALLDFLAPLGEPQGMSADFIRNFTVAFPD